MEPGQVVQKGSQRLWWVSRLLYPPLEARGEVGLKLYRRLELALGYCGWLPEVIAIASCHLQLALECLDGLCEADQRVAVMVARRSQPVLGRLDGPCEGKWRRVSDWHCPIVERHNRQIVVIESGGHVPFWWSKGLDSMVDAEVGQMGQGSQFLGIDGYGEAHRNLNALLDAGMAAEWNLRADPLESGGNRCWNSCSHLCSHHEGPAAASSYCNMAALPDIWSPVVSHPEMDNDCHGAQRS